jgi:hypothetical protein
VADTARLQRSIQRAARRLEAIAAELNSVEAEKLSGDEWLRVRARIGNLTADFNDRVSEVDRLLGTTGGRARILRYLQLRLGEIVTKEELSGVAGIYEWARRVRELRMDDGWAIHSAETRHDLRVGEYILELARPDEDLARSWTLARKMRKLRTAGGAASPRVRLLEYLKALYPKSADSEQLAYVAGSSGQCARCLEELSEDGWLIVSSSPDGSLTSSSCRLASLERQT